MQPRLRFVSIIQFDDFSVASIMIYYISFCWNHLFICNGAKCCDKILCFLSRSMNWRLWMQTEAYFNIKMYTIYIAFCHFETDNISRRVGNNINKLHARQYCFGERVKLWHIYFFLLRSKYRLKSGRYSFKWWNFIIDRHKIIIWKWAIFI